MGNIDSIAPFSRESNNTNLSIIYIVESRQFAVSWAWKHIPNLGSRSPWVSFDSRGSLYFLHHTFSSSGQCILYTHLLEVHYLWIIMAIVSCFDSYHDLPRRCLGLPYLSTEPFFFSQRVEPVNPLKLTGNADFNETRALNLKPLQHFKDWPVLNVS